MLPIRHGHPWVIGHRGARGHAPENTLAGFQKGLELGADMVECDVHLSQDEQVVVHHDSTTPFGRIRDLTLQELQQGDPGLPSLEQLLTWLQDKPLAIAIEIKDGIGTYPGITAQVIDAIRRHHLEDRTIIISFDPETVASTKRMASDIAAGWLFADMPALWLETARKLRADAIWPRLGLLNAEMADDAHRHGLTVFTWLANEPEAIQDALARGVDGIGSDFPERVVKAIALPQLDAHDP